MECGELLYVLYVVIGAQGAPDRVLLGYITGAYGIFSVIFSASAFMYVRKSGSKLLNAGLIIFLFMFIVSMTYGLFPEDLLGSPMTFQDLVHYVVTGIIVSLTILSPLLTGVGMRKIGEFRRFSVYSIATSIIILTAGGISVVLAVNRMNYFGLFERINICSLQLWMFLISLKLFTSRTGMHAY